MRIDMPSVLFVLSILLGSSDDVNVGMIPYVFASCSK